MADAQGLDAADDRRQPLYREPDATRAPAREVRQLDRAAAHRHRQQARRLRIREDRVMSLRGGEADAATSVEQMSRIPSSQRYFEDYPVGLVDEFGNIEITADDIVAFARSYDPQPMHIDP